MTITDNIAATAEEIEVRDIDTLLRLSSYSEMNDYEVDLVVQWKANNLADEYWRIERDKVLRENIKAMQEMTAQAKKNADESFKRAISFVPQFEEVSQ